MIFFDAEEEKRRVFLFLTMVPQMGLGPSGGARGKGESGRGAVRGGRRG